MHQIKESDSKGGFVFFFWKNFPRFILLFLVLAIIVLSVLVFSKWSALTEAKKSALAKERPPVNIVTLTINPQAIHDRINLPGTIEAWTDLKILAKISGTVEKVLVQEGDLVKKGDLLAVVEEADYKIRLQRARAAYKLAKNEFNRDKAIYSKGVISAAEFDAKKIAMEIAKADLNDAELQFSRCQITSPMNGIVRHLDAKVGLLLSVADPVAEIIEMDRVKAVIGIPESDVSAVRKLDEVELDIQALGNKKITGKKYFLSPSPESAARLYNLELEIENDSGEILPGMFVRADIVKKSIENALVIPFYSVITRNDEQFVFIEENDVVSKRPVKLGIMEQWMVEVVEGLGAGEKLVIEGHRDVEDGQKVKVVETFEKIEDLKL